MRYGERPTVTEFDTKTTIPDESCQNSQSLCSEQSYDILLVHDLLSKPGTYFIGILYEKNGDGAKRRKRRSCFGARRKKRSCVEFKDPPRPENITVKPAYDPKTDVNYSMSILEEKCLFWNSTEERWESGGCKVS